MKDFGSSFLGCRSKRTDKSSWISFLSGTRFVSISQFVVNVRDFVHILKAPVAVAVFCLLSHCNSDLLVPENKWPSITLLIWLLYVNDAERWRRGRSYRNV